MYLQVPVKEDRWSTLLFFGCLGGIRDVADMRAICYIYLWKTAIDVVCVGL